MKLYKQIASSVDAYHRVNTGLHNDTFHGDPDWFRRHRERAELLTKNFMPSGPGVDCGTKLLIDESTGERLVFTMDFHHMDEHGGYDGWTEHKVIIKPSLIHDIDIRITGRDRNDIKELLDQLARYALEKDIEDATIKALYEKADI